MPLYLPKRVSSQPPAGARINWNNPITKNLVVARVPGDDPRGSLNLTVDGYGVNGRQTTNNGLLSTNSAVGSNSFSFLVLFRTPAFINSGLSTSLIGRGVDSPAANIGFGFNISQDATYAGAFYVGSAYTVIGKPAGTPVADTEYCIAGTYNGSVGYGYSNGVRTVGPTSATISDTTARLALNADSRLTAVSTSRVYGVFYWNRVLSDAEVASVSNNPWQIFATSSVTVLGSSITYTYARPASDITTQWTPSAGTDHFALIDETTANDSDYIYATAAGQTDEVRLASMTAPQAGTDLLINYRVQGIAGSASVTMSLRQGSGGTLIATDTAKTSDNTYQLVVPAATWSSTVTDWTDLRLRFVSA